MKIQIAALMLLVTLALPNPADPATLLRVIDGDTVVVEQGKRKVRIRMAKIDAPELKQQYGVASRDHLVSLLDGRTIKVSRGAILDFYGRRLAVLSTDKCRNVNLRMVTDGFAWNYRNKAGEFAAAQNEAKKDSRGLWEQASPQSPWDYRKAKKKPKLELIGDFSAPRTVA